MECEKVIASQETEPYCILFHMQCLCSVVQVSSHKKGSDSKIFPDYANTDVALWDGERDNIRIPASVFSIGNVETQFSTRKRMSSFHNEVLNYLS